VPTDNEADDEADASQLEGGDAASVWQPAQENTVLSPKTDPPWPLSA
jgi:hypothetical protein